MAMTQRERYLAMGVGVVVSLFGANYAFTTVRETINGKQDLVDLARKESDNIKRTATSGALAARKLEQLKIKSLPTSQEALVAQYTGWLTKIAGEVGVTNIKVPSQQPLKKTKAYDSYRFVLTGECRPEQWLDLLAKFYDADYLHRVQNTKVTVTKDPNVLQFSLESHALALRVASPKQEPSGQSSGRLAMTADEYKQKILGRNPFGPPNAAPKLVVDKSSFDLPRGAPWDQILKTEDAENHEVELSIVSEKVPEGLSLSGKTVTWNPKENGTYEVLVKATDKGWPRASTERKLTLNVVDPPKPVEPAPPPPKFDVATQAFVSSVTSGRTGTAASIRSRIEGKTIDLSAGTEFEIGSVKAKVVDINVSEQFVELESDGVRWTIDMDTSLADAFAKSKID